MQWDGHARLVRRKPSRRILNCFGFNTKGSGWFHCLCYGCVGTSTSRASLSVTPEGLPPKLSFEFDVYARGEVEVHEGVHGFRGSLEDVDKALVGAHFEMLT